MSFKQTEKNGIKVFIIEEYEKLGIVKHGFSTRVGGISKGAYAALNLGVHTGDRIEHIQMNTKKLCDALEVDLNRLVRPRQVHKDRIKIVTEKDKGNAFTEGKDMDGFDGLITNVKGIPLMTLYADCVPLFFLDPFNKAIGLTHSGWPGTAMKIGQKTILKMMNEFGTQPEKVIVGIGPSIGKCCYEVGEEVIRHFIVNFSNINSFITSKGRGKFMLDLWEANRIVLQEIGVLDQNIILSHICTSCNTNIFYSHRKERGKTGRMAAIMELCC